MADEGPGDASGESWPTEPQLPTLVKVYADQAVVSVHRVAGARRLQLLVEGGTGWRWKVFSSATVVHDVPPGDGPCPHVTLHDLKEWTSYRVCVQAVMPSGGDLLGPELEFMTMTADKGRQAKEHDEWEHLRQEAREAERLRAVVADLRRQLGRKGEGVGAGTPVAGAGVGAATTPAPVPVPAPAPTPGPADMDEAVLRAVAAAAQEATDRATASVEALTAERDDALAKLAAANAKLGEVTHQVVELQAAAIAADARAEQVAAEAAAQGLVVADLRAQLQRATAAGGTADAAATASLTSQVATLTVEVETLREAAADGGAAAARAPQLEEQVSTLTSQLEAARAEVATARAATADAQAQAREAAALLTIVTSEKAQADAEVERLRAVADARESSGADAAGLRSALSTAEAANTALQAEVESLRVQVVAATEHAGARADASHASALLALRTALEEAQQAADQEAGKHKAALEQQRSLLEEVQTQRNQITELHTLSSTRAADVSRLAAENEALLLRLQEAQAATEQLRADHEVAEERLQAKLAEMTRRLQDGAKASEETARKTFAARHSAARVEELMGFYRTLCSMGFDASKAVDAVVRNPDSLHSQVTFLSS